MQGNSGTSSIQVVPDDYNPPALAGKQAGVDWETKVFTLPIAAGFDAIAEAIDTMRRVDGWVHYDTLHGQQQTLTMAGNQPVMILFCRRPIVAAKQPAQQTAAADQAMAKKILGI